MPARSLPVGARSFSTAADGASCAAAGIAAGMAAAASMIAAAKICRMVVLPDAAPVAHDAAARFAAKGTRSGGTAQGTQVSDPTE